ncbi:MAG: sensor histidine kinase, partial [Methanosarcina sp.]
EKLYQSEDMVSVDFADYIRNLTDYLLKSYSLGNKKIKLKLNVEKVFLGMDTAVPLGIIINELVSNSLKHAFLEGKDGEVSICLKREENEKQIQDIDSYKQKTKNPGEWFFLIVEDNGAGFPKEMNFRETDSLGLQLVVNLVEQIEGSIKLDTAIGTKFIIRFKELKSKSKN